MFAMKDARQQTKHSASPNEKQQEDSSVDFQSMPYASISLQRNLGNSYFQTNGEVFRSANGLPSGETFDVSDGCAIQRFEEGDGTCANCSRNEEDELRMVQPKLFVGSAGDRYEQEADRVADQVMRLSKSSNEQPHLMDSGAAPLQRQEDEENANNPIISQIETLLAEDGLQAKGECEGVSVTDRFESTLAATKGGGHSIPDSTKTEMETAFGVDFSGVRIHTDSTAVQMSQQINAHAFTHGQDIYFNEARFNPSTNESKHLLAHELMHTLQQGGNRIDRMAITRNSRTALTCGGSQTRWTFTLDNPAPQAGYFVQRIRMLRTIENCPSNVSSISLAPWLEFWEAMDVNSGDTRPSYHSSIGYSDMSGIAPEPNKSGCVAALGTIKFFPRSKTGDLGSLGVAPTGPGSVWSPGGVPMSGSLPSTATEPSWWKDTPTEGPARRWASSWWNCCADPANQRNEIDSSP